VTGLAVGLLLGAAPLAPWHPGVFRGVVTGESRLDVARRAFGAPINEALDEHEEGLRRVTFRPIAVDVPAVDGGTASVLQVGVQMLVDTRTRRIVRIRLTPWPESRASGPALLVTPVDRRVMKQIVDVPFTERRLEYCEDGPLWPGGGSHGDPEPEFVLLAPEHGVTVWLHDRKYLEDIEISATAPRWLTLNPCPMEDVGHEL